MIWLPGNGNGTFQLTQSLALGNVVANSLSLGDVNGDGKLDLVATDSSRVSLFLGNGDGTFQAARSTSLGQPTSQVLQVLVADLSGDGKPDLAILREMGRWGQQAR